MKSRLEELVILYTIKIETYGSELIKLNKNLKKCSTDIDKYRISNSINRFEAKKETLKYVVKDLKSVLK